MKISSVRFGIVLLASSFSPFVSAAPKSSNAKGPQTVRPEMGQLYATISEMLPIVLNKAAFEDPKNRRVLATDMNQLSALTRQMAQNSDRFKDLDPSISFLMERFNNDIRYAIDMWNRGDREVSRHLLQNVTDYCISCHTRTSKGMHFNQVSQPKGFKSMPSLSKAEYLAATRQFEDALKQYEHVLVDKPLAKTDPQAWSNAVKKMLAITVRVQNDPSLTLEMISRIQDVPESMPPHLHVAIAVWRKAAKDWASEPKTEKPLVGEERNAKIKSLLAGAETAEKEAPGGALIQHLRASNLLHEILGKKQTGDSYQELLWLAGNSAKYLRDMNMWTMQDIYFERCVRVPQGSKELSGKCLTALEESMFQSYGVASYEGLPTFAKTQIDKLKAGMK